MDRGLFKLLAVNIIYDYKGGSGPGLIIISHLADAQAAADRQHQIAVLNRNVPGAACIQGMRIPNTVLAVPACDHGNPQLFGHLHENIMCPGNTDPVSGIDHRTSRSPDP